jgi:hypothetical protein
LQAVTILKVVDSWWFFFGVRTAWMSAACYFEAWWLFWMVAGAAIPEVLSKAKDRQQRAQLAQADAIIEQTMRVLKARTIPPTSRVQ